MSTIKNEQDEHSNHSNSSHSSSSSSSTPTAMINQQSTNVYTEPTTLKNLNLNQDHGET